MQKAHAPSPLLKEFGNLSNKKLVVVRLSVNPPLHVNQKELCLFNDLVSKLEIGRVSRDWKGWFTARAFDIGHPFDV